jgi:hypothetical protein
MSNIQSFYVNNSSCYYQNYSSQNSKSSLSFIRNTGILKIIVQIIIISEKYRAPILVLHKMVVFSLSLFHFLVSICFCWVSYLSYPNLLGTKGLVVVVHKIILLTLSYTQSASTPYCITLKNR